MAFDFATRSDIEGYIPLPMELVPLRALMSTEILERLVKEYPYLSHPAVLFLARMIQLREAAISTSHHGSAISSAPGMANAALFIYSRVINDIDSLVARALQLSTENPEFLDQLILIWANNSPQRFTLSSTMPNFFAENLEALGNSAYTYITLQEHALKSDSYVNFIFSPEIFDLNQIMKLSGLGDIVPAEMRDKVMGRILLFLNQRLVVDTKRFWYEQIVADLGEAELNLLKTFLKISTEHLTMLFSISKSLKIDSIVEDSYSNLIYAYLSRVQYADLLLSKVLAPPVAV